MKLIGTDQALLSIGQGGSSIDVAGLTRRSFTLSRPATDRSDEAGGGWSTASALAAPARAELRAEGVFLSGAAMSAVRTVFLGAAPESFTLHLPEDGSWTSDFLIRSLSFDGRAEGEVRFSIRLVSTGPVTFAPAN
ncbi:phage tail tube protein [Parvularcula lutaonensis]|uniref:Phage tail tube protein n=1 Tax=Parvularcula lutaonensis TaxID=491923 RepID=A0ABV7MDT1_9PROT|nr:phage tail tube protein [Parvularcula lutaonensis]GGY53210.1 hypothetical protein GCM10007148_23060 [Parvularcula lutaonensis]